MALCGIGGLLCLAALPFVPPLVSMCLAYEDAASRGRAPGGGPANADGGDSCCFGGSNTSDGLHRMVDGAAKGQSQPYWRGAMYGNLYRDAMNALGLGGPAQRGSYTDGGNVMGSGAREMRGPGGTIGAISDDQEETVGDAVLAI